MNKPSSYQGRERFKLALAGNNIGRPPLWVMRQAGRYLPEYRALKQKYDFLTMVKTPELAVEVTLQPLARFDLDAAILFSDILVIPEAMGQGYHFREQGGIEMEFPLATATDIKRLKPVDVRHSLSYVEDALKILRTQLGTDKALLGFCGSPWTLACYMIDGGSSDGFPQTVKMANEEPVLFGRLLEKITEVLIDYITMQFNAGVDALQIFDSWHALCPTEKAWEWSLSWIHAIVQAVPAELALILYAKSPSDRLKLLASTGVDGISVDQGHDLAAARKTLPLPLALQGNLAPELMETDAKEVQKETHKLLSKMNGDPGHILNLGHGIRPTAKIECMEALVQATQSYQAA